MAALSVNILQIFFKYSSNSGSRIIQSSFTQKQGLQPMKEQSSSEEVQLHFGEVLNSRSNMFCCKDWIDFTVFEALQYSRRFKVFILVPASSEALRPAYLEVKLRSRYTNCLQVGRSAQAAPLNYLNLWVTNSGSDKQPSNFRWKHENLLQLWGWLTHQGFSSVRWRGSFLKVKNMEANQHLIKPS